MRNVRYLIALGTVWSFLLASTGCISSTALNSLLASNYFVSGTSLFYMPLVAQRFSPKSHNLNIPILEHPPKQTYLVIGKFAFETPGGVGFIHKSLQYNARKNGADAIIMRSLTSRRREWIESKTPWVENKAPWVESRTKADFITNCDGTKTAALVNYPVYHPGYTIQHPGYTTQMEQILTSVQAEMIIYQR